MEVNDKESIIGTDAGIVWKTVDNDPSKLKELMEKATKKDGDRSKLSLLRGLFEDRPQSPEKGA